MSSSLVTSINTRPKCHCGTDSVCRTSRSEENPGRRFWGCGNYDRDSCKVCHFFEWVDPDVLVGANVVLQRLERKIEDQSKEIKLLKKFVLFLICVELIKLLLY
uniref:GRF-type domain-containing protein n=1 Tax=Cannabis sativa TaxID=3483 RepID=A0A803R9E9_CANSA